MGKSAPSPPPPPDPYKTAAAQTGSNIGTAIANAAIQNANVYGPTGSTTFNVSGYMPWTDPNDGKTYQIPRYTQTTQLSPEQQTLYNQQTQLGTQLNQLGINQVQRIGDVLSSPISTANLPQGGTLPTSGPQFDTNLIKNVSVEQASRDLGGADYESARKHVEDALFGRLNPQLEQDRLALENRLVNQGLVRGSEAFNRAMDEANRASNDARLAVIAQAGTEQDRLFNELLQRGQFSNAAAAQNNAANLAAAGFTNAAIGQGNDITQRGFENALNLAQARDTARERGLQETLALRNQPINEVSALMRGGQVTMPQFSPYRPPNIPGTDISGMIYGSNAIQQQQYQQQLAAQNAALGGLFGLGQAGLLGLMLSDRTAKRAIVDLGIRLRNGLKLYAYRYLGETKRRIGVMADEVESILPAAVVDIGGLKAVDYGLVVRA